MSTEARYPRVGSFSNVAGFQARLRELNLDLPCDDAILPAPASPLARELAVQGRTLANRWTIHPMEGWDGSPEGFPTDLVLRRWKNFGLSGAALIWGGEALAVRMDGRANPNQLCLEKEGQRTLDRLYQTVAGARKEAFGNSQGVLFGAQLTHSGRFSCPQAHGKRVPVILYHHPLLDAKFGLSPDYPVISDRELEDLARRYVASAVQAERAGFDFVDIKHCHGYLGHEILSAKRREGPYGGSLQNRLRFLTGIVKEIRARTKLLIGVRLSAFDFLPFQGGEGVTGSPMAWSGPYSDGFGCDPAQPLSMNLKEPIEVLKGLRDLDIRLVNITAGSPYYNPHIQRPALFPPSDGYEPPEDPLVGVARQAGAVRDLKKAVPELVFVGSAYSYLQDYLPQVAQALVGRGWVDSVGLGRMVLSYPDLPRDVLEGRPLKRKFICRTFSDCTTSARKGLVSGCYPLDPYYRALPGRKILEEAKKKT